MELAGQTVSYGLPIQYDEYRKNDNVTLRGDIS
jgi:hypothetical protein